MAGEPAGFRGCQNMDSPEIPRPRPNAGLGLQSDHGQAALRADDPPRLLQGLESIRTTFLPEIFLFLPDRIHENPLPVNHEIIEHRSKTQL